MKRGSDFDAMHRPVRALLHDIAGRYIAETTVHQAAPEVLKHDGKRYELAESEDGFARYFEARVGD